MGIGSSFLLHSSQREGLGLAGGTCIPVSILDRALATPVGDRGHVHEPGEAARAAAGVVGCDEAEGYGGRAPREEEVGDEEGLHLRLV